MPVRASPDKKPLPRLSLPPKSETSSRVRSPLSTPAYSRTTSTTRLRGTITQRRDRFTAVQADVLKTETGPVTRSRLKAEGFTPQVSLTALKPGKSTLAFAGPSPGGKGKATGIITRGTGVETSVTGGRNIARHELVHHILPLSGQAEHAIIGLSTTRKGLNIKKAQLLATKPVSERVTMKMKSTLGRGTPGAPNKGIRLGLEGTLRAREGLGTQGFQTPQLMKTAALGSENQRATARTQMRKLGQRLKGKVDF